MPLIAQHLIKRHFTTPNMDVLGSLHWKVVDVVLRNKDGDVMFEQAGVEVPERYTMAAATVVARKYFAGHVGKPDRETSLKQVFARVTKWLVMQAVTGGYVRSREQAEILHDETLFMLCHGLWSPNSPVHFNAGRDDRLPQMSACFINGVEDSLESIFELLKIEAMEFKGGSGAGTNWSKVRGLGETLNGGGYSSGMLSLHKPHDCAAGQVKSGGKTRRAAKMIILDVDHPEIGKFIGFKAHEERKAKVLIEAGYSGGMDGEAYGSVSGQNANYSVRIPDAFMRKVTGQDPDPNWRLIQRTDGATAETMDAKVLFDLIVDNAHASGDPGVQFSDTIEHWHKSPSMGHIRASNPCAEYLNADDTSCNLASLNLMWFLLGDGSFDVASFQHAVGISILLQDVVVGETTPEGRRKYGACYPTSRIRDRTQQIRPLGLGFCNFGALVMSQGLPYDSDGARLIGAGIASLMTATAYRASAILAADLGYFPAYKTDEAHCRDTIERYRAAHELLFTDNVSPKWLTAPLSEVTAPACLGAIAGAASVAWTEASDSGMVYGFRNDEVTSLAPTGTIAFLMDAETSTSGESVIALVQTKTMAGGGSVTMVAPAATRALRSLGVSPEEFARIQKELADHGHLENAGLPESVLAVFDTSFAPMGGSRSIRPFGHLGMLGAFQMFISMGISKTVNLPSSATRQDVSRSLIMAWEFGCKAVSIYVDGSKGAQPVQAGPGSGPGTGPGKPAQDGPQDGPQNSSQNAQAASLTPPAVMTMPRADIDALRLLRAAADPGETDPLTTVKRLLERYESPEYCKMPNPRLGATYSIHLSGSKFYLVVNRDSHGTARELIIRTATEGSTVDGMLSTFVTLISIALRSGVPVERLAERFRHVKFEPAGFTEFGPMTSFVDGIFSILERDEARYQAAKREHDELVAMAAAVTATRGSQGQDHGHGHAPGPEHAIKLVAPVVTTSAEQSNRFVKNSGGVCGACGSITFRDGSCMRCNNCGATSGCGG